MLLLKSRSELQPSTLLQFKYLTLVNTLKSKYESIMGFSNLT